MPLVLRGADHILFILERVVEVDHIILHLPLVLGRQLRPETLVRLLQQRDARHVRYKRRLLVLVVVLNIDLLLPPMRPLVLHCLCLFLPTQYHLLWLPQVVLLLLLVQLVLVRRQLGVGLGLSILRRAVPLGTQLLRVILEKDVELLYALLDVFEVADLLAVEQLVLGDARLLQHHYQLLALPDNVIRKVCPLQLRLIEHPLAVRFFFLEDEPEKRKVWVRDANGKKGKGKRDFDGDALLRRRR